MKEHTVEQKVTDAARAIQVSCSPLDTLLTFTRFDDLSARNKTEVRGTLRGLGVAIKKKNVAEKHKLRLFSGATFGDQRSEKGSLRSKANCRKVLALFGDYDAGLVSMSEAAERLKKADLAALTYTTPSNMQGEKGYRWRVVLPLSRAHSPSEYAALVARANGALGGILADESFRVAQSFYIGSVAGNVAETILVEGRFTDQATELDAGSIGTARPPSAYSDEPAEEAEDQSAFPAAVAQARAMLEYANGKILAAPKEGRSRTHAIYSQAFHLGGYVACATLTRDEAAAALFEAAEAVGYLADYGSVELERHIDNGLEGGLARPLLWHDPLSDLPNEDPEIDAADKLRGTANAKPKVDPVTERLNQRHALVRHGAKTLVADFVGGRVDFGPVEGLHALYANDLVPTGTKGAMIPASKHWLTRIGRRQYLGGIVFDPSGCGSEDALNLYTGLAVKPDFGQSCARILAHVHDVIAAGSDRHFKYIIGWLAHLVQRPEMKPGVALVLRGGKGAGKDTLAVIMGKIIGRKHVAHVIRSEDLTGRFNAPFATALLIHVEEAYWSGDASKKGTLQALITAPTQPIERKGIDRIEVDSFVRVMMTTNDEWAVPASEDERRYAVFDVSDVHRRDTDWFGSLYAEIDGGGPSAFLAYLMSVDLSCFEIRAVPQTDALRDQKIASLRGVERWWFEVLDRGNPGELGEFADWSGSIAVEKEALRSGYAAHLRQSRHGGDPVDPAAFTKRLKMILGGNLDATRPRAEGERVNMFLLPSLATCRASFEKWLGASVVWSVNASDEGLDAESAAMV